MRYRPIDSNLFSQNRARLRDHLEPGSLVVVNANDVLPTNADGTMPYRQNSDFFYLTGVNQENSIFVQFPDAPDPKHREMLFLTETSEHIAIWEGEKLTKEQARAVSGIEQIHWLEKFEGIFRTLMTQAGKVCLNTNEHARATDVVETRDLRFIRQCRHKYPLHEYRRLAPIMHELRAHKSQIEVELISEACRITEKGFRRILGFVKPGVSEFEVEAELIHEYLRNRADGFAYPPIIAAGRNSCVLHYIENDKTCQDGDVLLLDVAAAYANYNSDLTRTIPVNGRFTRRQRAVYDAVLRVFREACHLLRPGVILREYNEEIGHLVESELIGLGLLDREAVKNQDPENPLYKKYFMHGTSHHLGLDVHDVGPNHEPVQEFEVFTVEPGIYIREEGFGVRLENDLLIGPERNIDLMESIPIEAEEIEELMNSGS